MLTILQRSISDELTRLSKSNIATVAISYIVMFFYIAISLGDFSMRRALVSSRACLFENGRFVTYFLFTD